MKYLVFLDRLKKIIYTRDPSDPESPWDSMNKIEFYK